MCLRLHVTVLCVLRRCVHILCTDVIVYLAGVVVAISSVYFDFILLKYDWASYVRSVSERALKHVPSAKMFDFSFTFAHFKSKTEGTAVFGILENLSIRSLVRSIGSVQIVCYVFCRAALAHSARVLPVYTQRHTHTNMYIYRIHINMYRWESVCIFLFAEWPWLLFWRARLHYYRVLTSHFIYIYIQMNVCSVCIYRESYMSM